MFSVGINPATVKKLRRRVEICDYLCVAQLYLRDNFTLERPLEAGDIKPRLLGHWGTCHGINLAYANLREFYKNRFEFILGPGHGFPALQANLFLDGTLEKIDKTLKRDVKGLVKLCRGFSWPGGFPSHSSPATPGVITEGGELGYALGAAYGAALGHPEKTLAVLIGDGELETATAQASLQLHSLIAGPAHGRVLPILHLNGHKITGPTIAGRKSERELNEFFRGHGFTPRWVGEDFADFQQAIIEATPDTFLIMKTEKGAGGPNLHDAAHQIPLKNPKTDPAERATLEKWLQSYKFNLEELR